MNVLWIALVLPFLGNTLGAAAVWFLKGGLKEKTQRALLGFAAGVMMAASVFSLLLPAMESAPKLPWLVAAGGFLIGIFFLLLLDECIPHMHGENGEAEGPNVPLKKSTKLFLAMTLHNLPEGMAVGAVCAGLLDGSGVVGLSSVVILSLGIAIQNFPEGAVLSLPLHSNGMSKPKAFLWAALSGITEPLGCLIAIVLAPWLSSILPWLLAFAAGAMMYVVCEELIPQSNQGSHSNVGVVSIALGFALMMVLDSAL
jgi:ZIP family zinc transporter